MNKKFLIIYIVLNFIYGYNIGLVTSCYWDCISVYLKSEDWSNYSYFLRILISSLFNCHASLYSSVYFIFLLFFFFVFATLKFRWVKILDIFYFCKIYLEFRIMIIKNFFKTNKKITIFVLNNFHYKTIQCINNYTSIDIKYFTETSINITFTGL